MANENEKKFRVESDLLGELQVPAEAYYGVQTQRAINNYKISGKHMCDYPEYVKAIAYVKLAAAEANHELGQLPDDVADAMCRACREIIDGKFHENFVTDMVQGGAGTSVNMNANEVIANRALELMGYEKGDYQHCWPNDHCNCGQSTNDVYPTTIRLTFIEMNKQLVAALERLVASFRKKGEEFKNNIKMGRTQLQDAVPMTSGQEFTAFANTLEEEIGNLNRNVELMLEINMGATAIGTGLNAVPGYAELCTKKLAELTGENFTLGKDLVEATPDTGDYVSYSGALKRLAVKLSKDLQRPPPHGLWSPLRSPRDQSPADGSGLQHHAGQGEPRHPRGDQPDLLQGDWQRHHRNDCRRGRTAPAQRHGAGHHPVHHREPDLAGPRHGHAA